MSENGGTIRIVGLICEFATLSAFLYVYFKRITVLVKQKIEKSSQNEIRNANILPQSDMDGNTHSHGTAKDSIHSNNKTKKHRGTTDAIDSAGYSNRGNKQGQSRDIRVNTDTAEVARIISVSTPNSPVAMETIHSGVVSAASGAGAGAGGDGVGEGDGGADAVVTDGDVGGTGGGTGANAGAGRHGGVGGGVTNDMASMNQNAENNNELSDSDGNIGYNDNIRV